MVDEVEEEVVLEVVDVLVAQIRSEDNVSAAISSSGTQPTSPTEHEMHLVDSVHTRS